MPDHGPGRLVVGEIRFFVFIDPVSEMPWLARLRLASLTPAGRKATWEVDEGDGPAGGLYSCRTRYVPPADPIEAIEEFQRDCVSDSPGRHREQLDLAVRQVVAAEAMKDKVRELVEANRSRVPIHR